MQGIGWRCDHKDPVSGQKIILTREDLNPGRTKQKGRGILQKNHTVTPVCAHFSHLRLSLTQPIHTFRVIKKDKKQIIFLFISIVVILPRI